MSTHVMQTRLGQQRPQNNTAAPPHNGYVSDSGAVVLTTLTAVWLVIINKDHIKLGIAQVPALLKQHI